MTKLYNPNTLCGAVQRALGLLGDAGAAEATGKSPSLVRAWADPDDDGHNIPAYQALALDAACKARGHGTPIADALARLLDDVALPSCAPPPLPAQMIAVTGDIGRLAETVGAAVSDDRLTAGEKQAICKAAVKAADALRLLVDAAAPPTPLRWVPVPPVGKRRR